MIDPGEAPPRSGAPAIDTAKLAGADDAEPSRRDHRGGARRGLALDLAPATYTPKPKIFSRAQWGADERMRDEGSLHYFEVHAGFVHHTVNANGYSRAQVPGIIRGIYAYHTQSRGWSDIGYNFLVDRFGRIWEGRYGGVDRPVVGAHTLGYNDYSFAMSAIGNFETAQAVAARCSRPTARCSPGSCRCTASTPRRPASGSASRNFQAINGHRDAGSTACPGKYLYAKIPQIRQLAAQPQKGWAGRQLESNLAGTARPDLVVRRAATAGLHPADRDHRPASRSGKPVATGLSLTPAPSCFNAGDWDRDGYGDLITRPSNGALYLSAGDGSGQFAPATRVGTGLQRGPAARRGRRHDRRRLAGPDGPAARRRDADLPRQRRRRAPPSYVAHCAVSAAGSSRRALGRRRRPGQPVPQRRS